MRLKNKNIIFLTDKKPEDSINVIKNTVEKEGGVFTTIHYDDSFKVKKNDIIIFNTNNSIEKIKKLKHQLGNFVSISFKENIFYEKLTLEMLHKFDNHIVDGDVRCLETDGCLHSKNRIVDILLLGIKMHHLKHHATIDAINKFFRLAENSGANSIMNIVDVAGKIIAINDNLKNIWGDIIGLNAKSMIRKVNGVVYNEDRPYLDVLKEDDIVAVWSEKEQLEIDLQLISIWTIEDGTTYYVRSWELLSNIQKYKELSETLIKINKENKLKFK